MTTSNALALALIDYKCNRKQHLVYLIFYYCLIALFTFGMVVTQWHINRYAIIFFSD